MPPGGGRSPARCRRCNPDLKHRCPIRGRSGKASPKNVSCGSDPVVRCPRNWQHERMLRGAADLPPDHYAAGARLLWSWPAWHRVFPDRQGRRVSLIRFVSAALRQGAGWIRRRLYRQIWLAKRGLRAQVKWGFTVKKRLPLTYDRCGCVTTITCRPPEILYSRLFSQQSGRHENSLWKNMMAKWAVETDIDNVNRPPEILARAWVRPREAAPALC
jgi:hypothetical protein